MSEHRAEIRWKRATPDFRYETYDRSHLIRFGGGEQVQASAAPEFRGKAELVNPEEQLVAALSSCHMLTFLAVAARAGLVVDSYEDEAVGTLEKAGPGRLWISRVVLRPRVVFSPADSVDADRLNVLHHQAHEQCFIANSVKTQVEVRPR